MALAEESPVYKASYDLVLAVFNVVKNFKKDFKYTIGKSVEKSAGTHTVQWDAGGVSSDVYFYLLKAGDFVQTKRMMVLSISSFIL